MSDSNEIERVPRRDVDTWADVFRPLVALAEHVHGTEFVPRALRGNAPATAAAMLYGRELGMGPMRALQTVHVVDGRPTLAAEAMRAMVFAAGHTIEIRENTRAKCVVAGYRRGGTAPTTVEWTMQDARDQGLAGKPNWRKMPRQMLAARATGELCRLVFPDVIGGAYTPEELDDNDTPDPQPQSTSTAASAPKRRTAQRKTPVRQQVAASTGDAPAADPDTTPATPQPPLPNEITTDEPEPADDGDETPPDVVDEGQSALDLDDGNQPVNRAQLSKMHAIFTAHDVTDRDTKLRAARVIAARPELTSSTELTRREASTILDTFARLETQAGDDFATALDALIDEHEMRALDAARDADTTSNDED